MSDILIAAQKIVGLLTIFLGICFNFLGCLGMLRMPDLLNRLQTATKAVTFGTSSIMFGVFILNGFSEIGVKALIVVAFLLLTAPISSHAIARGARIFGVKFADNNVCDAYSEEKRSEKRD